MAADSDVAVTPGRLESEFSRYLVVPQLYTVMMWSSERCFILKFHHTIWAGSQVEVSGNVP